MACKTLLKKLETRGGYLKGDASRPLWFYTVREVNAILGTKMDGLNCTNPYRHELSIQELMEEEERR